jgi:peroxiredoxin Q/BCP
LRRFDVALFAASTDDPETNRRFAESLDLPYPILSDPSRAAARAFGVVGALLPWASRWTFYIARNGRIMYVDKSVRTKTAGADIAARLRALGVAERTR